MYFDLTADQKALRDMLTSFLRRRLGGSEIVEITASPAIDASLWASLRELGLGGILVSPEQGGLGMDLLTLTVVAETMGRFAAPAPAVPNALAAWLIAESGTGEQQSRWLAPLISGTAIAAFALPECAVIPAEGRQSPFDGKSAMSILAERGAEADLFIVGLSGGTLALAERGAGVTAEPVDSLDRTRPLAEVTFAPQALSRVPSGAPALPQLVDALLITQAADALGAAASVHEQAVAYAKERRQYGRLIGAFQALKHQLADISVELEPARPLCWYAAHCWDRKTHDTSRIAAIAKAHLGEVAVQACRAAIEAFGGIGYTWEHPAHIYLKRAMFDRTFLGTPATHRERAAALAGWGTSARAGVSGTRSASA